MGRRHSEAQDLKGKQMNSCHCCCGTDVCLGFLFFNLFLFCFSSFACFYFNFVQLIALRSHRICLPVVGYQNRINLIAFPLRVFFFLKRSVKSLRWVFCSGKLNLFLFF